MPVAAADRCCKCIDLLPELASKLHCRMRHVLNMHACLPILFKNYPAQAHCILGTRTLRNCSAQLECAGNCGDARRTNSKTTCPIKMTRRHVNDLITYASR